MTTEHDWKKLYHAAVMETDWSRIEDHIHTAESAINDRLHQLSLNDGTPGEKEKIANAAVALEALRKDVATWKLKQPEH